MIKIYKTDAAVISHKPLKYIFICRRLEIEVGMPLCPFSKSKFNIYEASLGDCLLYLPNVRAIQYKLEPGKVDPDRIFKCTTAARVGIESKVAKTRNLTETPVFFIGKPCKGHKCMRQFSNRSTSLLTRASVSTNAHENNNERRVN